LEKIPPNVDKKVAPGSKSHDGNHGQQQIATVPSQDHKAEEPFSGGQDQPVYYR